MGKRRRESGLERTHLSESEAIIYGRISDEVQEDGWSLDSQTRHGKAYATSKGFHVIEEIYTTESAFKSGRKDFNRMLERIRDVGRPMAVIVEKPDRLFRNLDDWLMVDKLIAAQGLEVHYFRENRVISQRSLPDERMLHAFQVIMAAHQVEKLSAEVKKGLTEMAAQGVFPAKEPIGYSREPRTKAILIDPARGPVVRRLFELYADGQHSIDDLLNFAKRNGLASAEHGRGALSKSTIERTLKNPFYTGRFIYRGDLHTGKHPPLVDDDLFHRVQDVLLGRSGGRYERRKFAFAGLLRCGYCHRAFTAELQKGIVYYHCSARRKDCVRPFYPEKVIQARLTSVVQQIRLDERLCDTVREGWTSSVLARSRFRRARQGLVDGEVTKLTRMIETWDLKLAEGTIGNEVYRERRTKLMADLDAARERMHEAKPDSDKEATRVPVAPETIFAACKALYIGRRAEQQRRFLDLIVSQVAVTDDDFVVTYRKPFAWLGEERLAMAHLPRRRSLTARESRT